MRTLDVEILHTTSCPDWQVVRSRIEALARDEGIAVRVTEASVDDLGVAKARHFPGSPTILIEGLDVEPPAAGAPVDHGLG